MYYVKKTLEVSASHSLKLSYKSKCENLHGHNWRVRVCLCGTKLNEIGLLVDFTDMKSHLDKIMKTLDHKYLNENSPFDKINPTAENIATYIFNEMKIFETDDIKVCEVEVWESDTSSAVVSL